MFYVLKRIQDMTCLLADRFELTTVCSKHTCINR